MDMNAFVAEWRLPKAISAFACCSLMQDGSAIIAGGKTNEASSSKEVYMLRACNQPYLLNSSKAVHLGKHSSHSDTFFVQYNLNSLNFARSHFTIT